jgi:hypothetical protein
MECGSSSGLRSGVDKGWESWWCMGPVWPRRQGSRQGVDLVISHATGAQQGLGGGLRIPAECGSGLGLGSGMAEGWGSQWCMDMVQDKRQGSWQGVDLVQPEGLRA